MTMGADTRQSLGWLESCNFVQIFRTFRLAIQPSKLGLAFVALVVTLIWGGMLDQFWRWADQGVGSDAIMAFHAGVGELMPETGAGNQGIFATWTKHSIRCVESMPNVGCVGATWALLSGCCWMATQHPWYALLFCVGALGIWSLLGGAICRIAAVQFARDETLGWREAVKFARERYFSGFLAAPLLPLVAILIVGTLLALGGAFLRIPYLGDVLGSGLFILAILGGGAIAFLTIGWAAGGWLFWPTIAVEGSESLDAVSRSFDYLRGTPWKALFYALVAGVYGYLCLWFVRMLAYLVLAATHLFVGFGTAPFGWWHRPDGLSKLEALWAAPTVETMRAVGAPLSGIEVFSGAVVGLWVSLVIVLIWAYLASFWLSGSTVIYFLLRQANDAMDLDDVYIETYEETEYEPEPREPAAPSDEPGAGVQVTIEGQPAEPAGDDQDAGEPDAAQADEAQEGESGDSSQPPGT